MELFYQVKQNEENNELKGIVENNRPVCCVSVRNLVAFTSCSDLGKKERNSKNRGQNIETKSSGSNVYVADMNTPWHCHLVKSNCCYVTHLDWDPSGVKLLIGSEDGQVEIYSMVEDILNKWGILYSGEFRGEPILASCWLTAPRKVSLIPDKSESMLYNEKYQVSAIRRGRGLTKSLEGALLVTATGLVTTVIRSSEDPSAAITGLEKMIPLRNQILFADMAYAKDGEIHVVCSSDKINHPIKLTRVNVSLVGSSRDKAEFTVNAGHSLFLPPMPDHSISKVKFSNKINTESLLIAVKNPDEVSSHLFLYELVSQQVKLNSKFSNSSGNDTVQTLKWQQIHSISFPGIIEEFSTLRIPISENSENTPTSNNHLTNIGNIIQPIVAVSVSNGNLHLIRTDNFTQVGVMNGASSNQSTIDLQIVLMKRDPDEIPEAKQQKIEKQIPSVPFTCLEFTWSGSLLLGIDKESGIHLYKIHPNIDASSATTLIELSMMGGLDPWDIMMCLKPNIIENITDRLSETFARQPPIVQGHYNTRILVIKSALYRLGCGGVTRTNDQQTLLTLHLVSGALKALLRPANLSSHDRGPAESLSNLLSSKGESLGDVDKVLLHLEAKEYAVEATLLQSLQQFLQWCADLSLKLLAILPDLRHSRAPGWEVCRDSKAVGTLRELIVLMRIWGLIRPACLPAFRKTSENLDVLPLLFRLLTKLSVAPHDPDESLIDDCCLLPSEVQMPNINAFYPSKNHGVALTISLTRNSPLQFEYGLNPSKWLNSLDVVKSPGYWMDGLRLLWLGKNPAGVKACNRCGCATLIQSTPRSPANKAWDNRWLKSCPCGGNWKIPHSLPQNKPTEPDPFLNF